ncbi:MAG: hypothetical protein NVS4B5_10600 [Vulcanimicrobiaceae bacterium]
MTVTLPNTCMTRNVCDPPTVTPVLGGSTMIGGNVGAAEATVGGPAAGSAGAGACGLEAGPCGGAGLGTGAGAATGADVGGA